MGTISEITSEGVLVTPRLFSPFFKNRNFSFSNIPGKASALPCTYLSLSEYYENWEALATSREEEKYLLPTNWELVYSLLESLKEKRKELQLPEKLDPDADSSIFVNWRAQLKQVLSSLFDSDFHNLIDQYNHKVFNHPNTKLNFKLIHPEEIKFKSKIFPTISSTRNLYAFLNRKLEIMPMFSLDKDADLEVLPSWQLPALEGKTSLKYDQSWISKLEKSYPDLFNLRTFKEPELPIFS